MIVIAFSYAHRFNFVWTKIVFVMPVDKDKIRALADRIRQNGKVDVNRFIDGGPESRHHNGRDYTLDEYKDEKRNEIIDAAYRKSLSRTEPKVPKITSRPADEAAGYERESKKVFDIASKYVNKGTVFNKVVDEFGEVEAVATNPLMYKDKDKFDYYSRLASDYLGIADSVRKEKPYQILGPSCIATATDNYGDKYYVSGNQTFKANPGKYGFVEIPLSELKRGDLVQSIANGIPVHAMIFDGYDSEGYPLFNYSNGGSDTKSIRKHSAYFFPKDDAFDENYAKAYRFVGNSDDNERWEREYNELNNKNAYGGFLRRYEDGGSEGDGEYVFGSGNNGYMINLPKNTDIPKEAVVRPPLTQPSYFYDNERGYYIPGFSNITKDINDGDPELYSRRFIDYWKPRFYRHNATGDIFKLFDMPQNHNINLDDYTEVPYGEIRKMLPKRDYIGGEGYRLKTAQRIPGFIDKIAERAKAYGINPNLLLHRILKEGFIDQSVTRYNNIPAKEQDGYWERLWNEPVGGFESFGLDDAGSNLLSGKYVLLDKNASWAATDAVNELGRRVVSVETPDLSSALEIKAAEMAYRQNELAKRGITGDAYTNAAYNGGLNWSRLSDADYITSNYSVPDYGVFGKGGKIHIKKSKRGTFTAAAKKRGKSVQAFASQVLANKSNYSPAMVKKANFARNAAKWHSDGGAINKAFDNGDIDVIRTAINNVLARKMSGK